MWCELLSAFLLLETKNCRISRQTVTISKNKCAPSNRPKNQSMRQRLFCNGNKTVASAPFRCGTAACKSRLEALSFAGELDNRYFAQHRRDTAPTSGTALWHTRVHRVSGVSRVNGATGRRTMDTENVAPAETHVRAPGVRKGLGGKAFVERAANGKGKGKGKSAGKGKGKGAGKGKAKAKAGAEAALDVRPRRALGDITNGGGGLWKGAKEKEALKEALKEGLKEGVKQGVKERAVPLGDDGDVADIEEIPAGGAAYDGGWTEPDLVAELGLGGRAREVVDGGELDELTAVLQREECAGIGGIDDDWDDIEFENDDGWHGIDVDLGAFVTLLPELYIDG